MLVHRNGVRNASRRSRSRPLRQMTAEDRNCAVAGALGQHNYAVRKFHDQPHGGTIDVERIGDKEHLDLCASVWFIVVR